MGRGESEGWCRWKGPPPLRPKVEGGGGGAHEGRGGNIRERHADIE